MSLVLASASPRRRELLRQIGYEADHVFTPNINEDPHASEVAQVYVRRLAVAKAQAGAQAHPGAVILAADTAVWCARQIIGKPRDRIHAGEILQALSGRRHRVLTGVCVHQPTGQVVCKVIQTIITFKRLLPREIDAYLDTNEWQGKAGACSIQGRAEGFVTFISGSYSNVMGLPLYQTTNLLRSAGLP